MAGKKRRRLGVSYNAPVTLTFSLAAVAILAADKILVPGLVQALFTVPGRIGSQAAFDWTSALDYARLFLHVLGHQDWGHLLSNLSFVLLLGPLLEERYGGAMLTLMIAVTALVTGVLNVCFVPRPMLGSSGVAFMMILLSSFTAISRHQIPLTFLLVLVLYMGRELAAGLQDQGASSLAHIAGGLCGSLFGFLAAHSPRGAGTRKSDSKTDPKPDSRPAPKADSAPARAKAGAGAAKAGAAGRFAPAGKSAPAGKPARDASSGLCAEEATVLSGDEGPS